MKLGVVQADSVQTAVSLTERALKEGARIVLLPEQWTVSFDLVPVTEFQRLARLYTSFIVIGAFNDGVSVIAPIISQSGYVAGIAKKIHVEGTSLIPGTEIIAFKHMGSKVGVLISDDLYYPDVALQVLKSNIDLLLVPSSVGHSKLDSWKCVLKLRAMETGSVILNANSYVPTRGVGHSAVYVPFMEQGSVDVKEVELLGEGEGYRVFDIDLTGVLPLKGLRALSSRDISVKFVEDQPR